MCKERGSNIRPGFAVDIDNVLAVAEPEVQKIYQEITGLSWPQNLYASAGGLDSSNLERNIINIIFEHFHQRSIPVLPVNPGSKKALEQLGHHFRIVVITARHPESRPQTLDWLQRHELPFDELHFSGDKSDVAENLVLAVDDHPEHAMGYSNRGIPVFLMDQPWNHGFSAPLVTRVHNWEGLLDSVQQQSPLSNTPFST